MCSRTELFIGAWDFIENGTKIEEEPVRLTRTGSKVQRRRSTKDQMSKNQVLLLPEGDHSGVVPPAVGPEGIDIEPALVPAEDRHALGADHDHHQPRSR